MTDPLAYENGIIGGRQMDVYECIAQVEADHLAAVAAAADAAAESHEWPDAGDPLEDDRLPLDHEFERWPVGSADDDDFTFLPRDYDRLEV